MRWGMAAKCLKHDKVHAFDTDEEKMPLGHLAEMGALAFKCWACPDFKQNPNTKNGEKRCEHIMVFYMKTEE